MSNTITATQLGLQSKLPNIKDSIFSVMSQKAREHQAINLSQGFPDFTCSPEFNLKRPKSKTSIDNLWLIGDYVKSPYPACLEAAVESGINVAETIRNKSS